MSVEIDKDHILLAGIARVEDAETLLAALIDHPAHRIDISGLTHAHLAIIQILHTARRPLAGQPPDTFLREVALAGLIQVSSG